MADNIKYGIVDFNGNDLLNAMVAHKHPTLNNFAQTLLDIRNIAKETNYVTSESKNPLHFGKFVNALNFQSS
jgi:hypothetical protein